MNPVNRLGGSPRARLVLVLTLLIALFFVTGCGSDGNDDEEPSNKWDEIRWDEGKWGSVTTSPYSVLIS